MSNEYPKYFYKYRGINNTENIENDYAIDALLKHEAILSSRTNFNDIFDSKIDLVRPTPKQLKQVKEKLKKPEKLEISKWIKNGEYTPDGIIFIQNLEQKFNQLIDSYAFICLSDKPNSNLMWSHYAKSHTGFCIEFKSELLRADKVIYANSIAQLHTIDFFKLHYGLIDGKNLGVKVWESLRTKLNEWAYESEFRFQLSSANGKIPVGQKFIKYPYRPEFVESIIFGCRMPEEQKQFIAGRMPKNTKFKQAVEKTNCVVIKNSEIRAG